MFHQRRVHNNSRPYHCRYCGKTFKTNSAIKSHVRIHTGSKRYSCRHCSERFTWPNQLKIHLLQSHNEGTWLTCHICEKKFSLRRQLERHLFRHEGVKPYVCSDCPKCFYTASELKKHQLVHSDFKQFRCFFFCNKSFRRKDVVKVHFKRCSAELGFQRRGKRRGSRGTCHPNCD